MIEVFTILSLCGAIVLLLKKNKTLRKTTDDALLRAQKMTEEASNAKSAFLANMGHEIRTPINAIIGMSDLLLDTELDETQKKYSRIINIAGESLLKVIKNVLDLSKIEAGYLILDHIPFDLRVVVSDSVDLFSEKIKRKNIHLRVHIENNVPSHLIGDPFRIQQIIVNLLENAVKFTHQGEIGVDVKVRNEDKKHTVVEINVSDSGVGIPTEEIHSIFDSFKQADQSLTRKYGGTGVGLSVSQKIAEKMGGGIGVQSRLGEGSRFVVTLNLGTYGELDRKIDDEFQKKNDVKQEMPPSRILLVDDSDDNLFLVKSYLKNMPCDLEMAKDGARALELFEVNEYDMVLLDIQMPVMDGYTAIKKMRELEERRKKKTIPIIALTAHAFKAEIDKCLALGFSGHLAKPIKRQKLVDTMIGFRHSV